MGKVSGIPVKNVLPGSIADELGVEPGDLLLTIQGQFPSDYIDFLYLTSDEHLEILIEKPSKEKWLLDFEREPGEELGIQLEGIIYDELKECINHCVFCFVHQMPYGLRKTLALRDDDYRFSFLQGSFITLTNLTDEDFNRIITLKLSPLYISVHTTDPELRKKMMGSKKAAEIMEKLKILTDAGIKFHAQIVLCPGINDGKALVRSIEDLSSFRPNLLSLAIVPVGLTKYREGLYPLTPFDKESAKIVLEIVKDYQKRFREDNFIYLADEFYLLTEEDFPEAEDYDGFPQLENGVGISRLVIDEINELAEILPDKVFKPTKILVVTGVLGGQVLRDALQVFEKVKNLKVEILTVKNEFFGETVTVTGLLTGQDIKQAVLKAGPEKYDLIVLPSVVLNDDGLFLDGMSCDELSALITNTIVADDFRQLVNYLMEKGLMEVKV